MFCMGKVCGTVAYTFNSTNNYDHCAIGNHPVMSICKSQRVVSFHGSNLEYKCKCDFSEKKIGSLFK